MEKLTGIIEKLIHRKERFEMRYDDPLVGIEELSELVVDLGVVLTDWENLGYDHESEVNSLNETIDDLRDERDGLEDEVKALEGKIEELVADGALAQSLGRVAGAGQNDISEEELNRLSLKELLDPVFGGGSKR